MNANFKKIGLVKERKNGENRVALIPTDVASLINAGHTVFVEKGAGIGAGFSDDDYINAHKDVQILSTRQLYKQCNFIVKVKEPIEFDLKYLNSQHTLFCYLHLAPNPELTQALCSRNINSYAFESIKDIHGKYPLLIPMSTIAGKLAVHFATEYIRKSNTGQLGKLIGPTTKVAVAGCGTSGAAAANLAIKLGCQTVVADINPRSMDKIPYCTHYCLSDPLEQQQFYNEVSTCDIFIGAVLIPNKKAPIILSEEHVKNMKKGAIIVDIAIDQGGCVETSIITSHSKPIEWIHGKGHICIPNMPGCVPETASVMISNLVADYILSGKYTDGANIINGEIVVEL